MEKDSEERRGDRRKDLTEFFPTLFNYQGSEYRSQLVNISTTGAKFQMEYFEDSIKLEQGAVLSLEIRTHRGVFNLKGTVAWSRHKGNYHTWGVAFDTEDDLLQAKLIELIDF